MNLRGVEKNPSLCMFPGSGGYVGNAEAEGICPIQGLNGVGDQAYTSKGSGFATHKVSFDKGKVCIVNLCCEWLHSLDGSTHISQVSTSPSFWTSWSGMRGQSTGSRGLPSPRPMNRSDRAAVGQAQVGQGPHP